MILSKEEQEEFLKEKDELLKDFLDKIKDCDICSTYAGHCISAPIRCPGLDINADGEYETSTGKRWADVVADFRKGEENKRKAYLKQHGEHIREHGIFTYIED